MTGAPRPVIGVIADLKRVTSGAWKNIPNDSLPRTYVDAVTTCGGDPVLFPSLEGYIDRPGVLLDLVDGLFLPGGRDVDAVLYGHDPHGANDPPYSIRDRLELALIGEAVRRDMPLLGACRGEQLINVALGGTLEQHLADRVDQTPHRDVVGAFTRHPVEIIQGTRLAAIMPDARFEIASHHHQAVDRLGHGLVPNAVAPDGVVEGVELPGAVFCVGVQWHPEEQLDDRSKALMSAFIEAAAGARVAA
ncbi:gamma-glutamyl-gamma-aminobutyrate hydrolase [Pseudoclavibacter endophyticus]|uniref:Gamma-glutamyl-gamma-aminobutyrate hydrolase family protein n=1 Tax=Pseudoclavibacter endophyticus TaxID=1778590 RepID=A0A6H9WQ57_9MICO|nr:gamma-glutamyl-gamma-aminobutyrate hydrolase family protein [Pseudoclavibacter endophyticus]KAB1648231.1 gamma-glutamyl-gamma-aminobutyrate hydrolase family protein [Pseudoclavibacter endophyticus]GGA70845.1 gamma-glutamyl-gamma-aminobutyrate hydrolase [Pseudoclavibacter endophyticus]